MNKNEMIDFRSDTVTKPTDEMRDAMRDAEVGDDVYREDPTVKELQRRAADFVGMEAALFVPSGSMGNQIAVHVHTDPGDEVILESHAHIVDYELAMISEFSGVMPRTIRGKNGIITKKQIKAAIRPEAYYIAPTGLICLENTHNMAGGKIYPGGIINEILELARGADIPVHLDGARICNAAAALDKPVSRLTEDVDSIMFCLSKGLSAPVGSIIAGNEDFIEQARRVRKKMGGGMRQVGILAAAGIVALKLMPQQLETDNRNARKLAEEISDSDRFTVDPQKVDTNIVMIWDDKKEGNTFVERLQQFNILASAISKEKVRFVTHRGIDEKDIKTAVERIHEIDQI